MITERRILLALSGVALVGALVVGLIQGEFWGFSFTLDLWFWGFAYTSAGALITRAEPGHSVGRLLMWGGLGPSLQFFGTQLASPWLVPTEDGWDFIEGVPSGIVALESVLGAGYLVALAMLVVAMARFPTGSWVTPMVGRLVWLLIPVTVLSSAGLSPAINAVLNVVGLLAIAYIVGAILVVTWRSGPLRRRQLGVVLPALVLYVVLGSLTGTVPEWVSMASMLLFPASIVVAITRYRLYELDRIVSRTVTYVVVIGLLVATYFGLVLVLRSLLPVEGPLPVALSTLAVAFAFFPLARRVQSFVDRRFFRSRYDAAEVVASFASELRGTIDAEAAIGRTESVVDDVFAPDSVSVWLAEDRV